MMLSRLRGRWFPFDAAACSERVDRLVVGVEKELAGGTMAPLVVAEFAKGEEYLILDPMAKLEQGCTVAVFLTGHFMLVGRIERRPSTHRRLVIRCRDVEGNEGVTRIYGLKDKDTQVWRVVGVHVPVPFADVDRGRD